MNREYHKWYSERLHRDIAFADAHEFAAACVKVATDSLADRDSRVAPLQRKHEWDVIAAGMEEILAETLDSLPYLHGRSVIDLRDGTRLRRAAPEQEQPA